MAPRNSRIKQLVEPADTADVLGPLLPLKPFPPTPGLSGQRSPQRLMARQRGPRRWDNWVTL
jgi:hypothetical protein